MKVQLPYGVRFALYVIVSVGGFVAAYALTKGQIGADEMVLWNGLSSFVAALAAFNTFTGKTDLVASDVEPEPVVVKVRTELEPASAPVSRENDETDWVNPLR